MCDGPRLMSPQLQPGHGKHRVHDASCRHVNLGTTVWIAMGARDDLSYGRHGRQLLTMLQRAGLDVAHSHKQLCLVLTNPPACCKRVSAVSCEASPSLATIGPAQCDEGGAR